MKKWRTNNPDGENFARDNDGNFLSIKEYSRFNTPV